jgi:hypothetical protein
MADRRRIHPVVWTGLGAIIGLIWAVSGDVADLSTVRIEWMTVLTGTLAGAFVSMIVAAWPAERRIPTVRCPRCGHPMPHPRVVCPECGEIR